MSCKVDPKDCCSNTLKPPVLEQQQPTVQIRRLVTELLPVVEEEESSHATSADSPERLLEDEEALDYAEVLSLEIKRQQILKELEKIEEDDIVIKTAFTLAKTSSIKGTSSSSSSSSESESDSSSCSSSTSSDSDSDSSSSSSSDSSSNSSSDTQEVGKASQAKSDSLKKVKETKQPKPPQGKRAANKSDETTRVKEEVESVKTESKEKQLLLSDQPKKATRLKSVCSERIVRKANFNNTNRREQTVKYKDSSNSRLPTETKRPTTICYKDNGSRSFQTASSSSNTRDPRGSSSSRGSSRVTIKRSRPSPAPPGSSSRASRSSDKHSRPPPQTNSTVVVSQPPHPVHRRGCCLLSPEEVDERRLNLQRRIFHDSESIGAVYNRPGTAAEEKRDVNLRQYRPPPRLDIPRFNESSIDCRKRDEDDRRQEAYCIDRRGGRFDNAGGVHEPQQFKNNRSSAEGPRHDFIYCNPSFLSPRSREKLDSRRLNYTRDPRLESGRVSLKDGSSLLSNVDNSRLCAESSERNRFVEDFNAGPNNVYYSNGERSQDQSQFQPCYCYSFNGNSVALQEYSTSTSYNPAVLVSESASEQSFPYGERFGMVAGVGDRSHNDDYVSPAVRCDFSRCDICGPRYRDEGDFHRSSSSDHSSVTRRGGRTERTTLDRRSSPREFKKPSDTRPWSTRKDESVRPKRLINDRRPVARAKIRLTTSRSRPTGTFRNAISRASIRSRFTSSATLRERRNNITERLNATRGVRRTFASKRRPPTSKKRPDTPKQHNSKERKPAEKAVTSDKKKCSVIKDPKALQTVPKEGRKDKETRPKEEHKSPVIRTKKDDKTLKEPSTKTVKSVSAAPNMKTQRNEKPLSTSASNKLKCSSSSSKSVCRKPNRKTSASSRQAGKARDSKTTTVRRHNSGSRPKIDARSVRTASKRAKADSGIGSKRQPTTRTHPPSKQRQKNAPKREAGSLKSDIVKSRSSLNADHGTNEDDDVLIIEDPLLELDIRGTTDHENGCESDTSYGSSGPEITLMEVDSVPLSP